MPDATLEAYQVGAITGVMDTTLPLAERGETFMLSNMPVWVRR